MFSSTDILSKRGCIFISAWNTCCHLLVIFFLVSHLLSFPVFSVAVCRFPNTGDDWYVLVGVARDMILNPRSVGGGFIYTYRLISGGEKLEFVHKVGLTLNCLK